jgi:DNA-binding MarR family transcriptional regulator
MARDPVLDSISRTTARLIRVSTSRSAFSRQAALADVSLSQPSYALLRVLLDGGPLTMGSLAGRCAMDVGLATRQVVTLEDQGLVRRQADPADGRRTIVEATPDGAAVAGRLQELRRRHLALSLAGWTAADLARFDALLTRFVADTTGTSFEDLASDQS